MKNGTNTRVDDKERTHMDDTPFISNCLWVNLQVTAEKSLFAIIILNLELKNYINFVNDQMH